MGLGPLSNECETALQRHENIPSERAYHQGHGHTGGAGQVSRHHRGFPGAWPALRRLPRGQLRDNRRRRPHAHSGRGGHPRRSEQVRAGWNRASRQGAPHRSDGAGAKARRRHNRGHQAYHRRCERQGRRGQVARDCPSGRHPEAEGLHGRHPRRGYHRPQHPTHVRRARALAEAGRGSEQAESSPLQGRHAGHVDERLARRSGSRRGVARPHGLRRHPPVLHGHELGRPRLPAGRPAAGHVRRADDGHAAAADRRRRAGEHAAGASHNGGEQSNPDGEEVRGADRGRGREYELRRVARRHHL